MIFFRPYIILHFRHYIWYNHRNIIIRMINKYSRQINDSSWVLPMRSKCLNNLPNYWFGINSPKINSIGICRVRVINSNHIDIICPRYVIRTSISTYRQFNLNIFFRILLNIITKNIFFIICIAIQFHICSSCICELHLIIRIINDILERHIQLISRYFYSVLRILIYWFYKIKNNKLVCHSVIYFIVLYHSVC